MTTSLTPRELDVLRCMARGLNNAATGRELFLSEATIKSVAKTVLVKLGARDRGNAVGIGFAEKLLSAADLVTERVR